jgi:hypothetical protein
MDITKHLTPPFLEVETNPLAPPFLEVETNPLAPPFLKVEKQFHKYVPLNQMKGLQWFALDKNYGESYGVISRSYRFKREPKLLDIGNANVRTMIKDKIRPMNDKIDFYSDPDEQYSGGESNKKYHEIVKTYFGDLYDGTIINEKHLEGNNEYSVEDLIGPSEIVLWKDYSDLLEELSNGGKKKKRKTRRRSKKHRKTCKRRVKY